MLVLAIGVSPDLGFIKEGTIETGRGIKVDSKMKTSAENVYASGDIVEGPDILLDLIRQGLEDIGHLLLVLIRRVGDVGEDLGLGGWFLGCFRHHLYPPCKVVGSNTVLSVRLSGPDD